MLTLRRLGTDADGLYPADVTELPLLAYYASSVAHLSGRLAETWPAASSAGGTSSRPAAEGLRVLARRIIPLKAPGGPVAARRRSVGSPTLPLERDQGLTTTVKFWLLPAFFHLAVLDDV